MAEESNKEEVSTENSAETYYQQRRRATRYTQRKHTKEISSIDVIELTNRKLRQILRLAGSSQDLCHLLLDTTVIKDREIVRLRRLVLDQQKTIQSLQRLVPKFKTKAQEARYLRNAVKLMTQKPRGRVAVEKEITSPSSPGDNFSKDLPASERAYPSNCFTVKPQHEVKAQHACLTIATDEGPSEAGDR